MLKHLPLNIDNKQKLKTRLVIAATVFVTLHLLNHVLPVFQTWNARFYDLLFSVRSEFSLSRPFYDETIVHVDLDDTSIQYFNNYYLNRSYHGKVVANLATMGVAAQLHDFIIAAPSNKTDDDTLIAAVQNSGNSYFGLAFRLGEAVEDNEELSTQPDVLAYLEATKWQLKTNGGKENILHGAKPFISFLPLARASRGLGFVNILADRDGVSRRIPLLVRFGQAYYPSLAFRAICDYLQVTQADITVQPGISITLQTVVRSEEDRRRNLVIPVDANNNLRINFIGPWGRMKHYHFSDIWRASEDQDEMELWKEELSDKVVVVSQVTTGSSDVGVVPTDDAYPLSGLNAAVVHTILTESFIRELNTNVLFFTEMLLLLVIVAISLTRSSIIFASTTFFATFLYAAIAVTLFLKAQIIVNLVVPILFAILVLLGLQAYRAIENRRELHTAEMEKGLFEKELEIGRQIQAGFFPEKMPESPGWVIDAFFRPARQVAGDFYDAFSLSKGRCTGVVISDVCDKGVGAALFMALVRSLIRASVLQDVLVVNSESENIKPTFIDQMLIRTIVLTNNYIAETHGSSNMFATLFIAVLNHETGLLHYINCGHEPPVIFKNKEIKMELKRTGPALGVMPDIEFKTNSIQLGEEDLLFAYTDGLTDAQNQLGELFSKRKLLSLAAENTDSPTSMFENILEAIKQHLVSTNQFDDITMLAIKKDSR